MAYWQECKVVRRNVAIPSPKFVKKDAKSAIAVPPPPPPAAAAAASAVVSSLSAAEKGIFVRFDIDLVHDTATEQPTSTFFIVEIKPEWAPLGAQRFLQLVESKFFDNCRFFRALPNFMAQFGIAADPKATAYWRKKNIPDDPVIASNERGYLTYAMAGPNTRTSQLFINFRSNAFLDKQKFAPFGRVVEGLETAVDAIYTGYGEGGNGKGTDGKGPNQNMLNNKGEAYLQELFPKLTIIHSVSVMKGDYTPPAPALSAPP
jgi:peptidyl-prolyl cis-trans isomerase A (cyclophilin A)